jgi:hypothetical protein
VSAPSSEISFPRSPADLRRLRFFPNTLKH